MLEEPDLLILDEPTNHLDLQAVEWLEGYLSQWEGAALIVSHDRYFLDNVAKWILELDRGMGHPFEGNYSSWLVQKQARLEREEKTNAAKQKTLQRELEWVRRGPEARRTKSKSRLSRYFEMADEEGWRAEEEVEFVVPPPTPLGGKVLNLKNLGLELAGRQLFTELDFQFAAGRKLGIVGRNGLGKTSLLRIILGELAPTQGRIERGDRTVFNYVDQSRVALNDENTVIREIGDGQDWIMFGDERMTVWRYLRLYLFADDRMNTKVGRLSGGERSRLLLAKILKNGGNVLILDEPTNDLDLSTMRVLEETLIAFGGCVIAVSHDRYFLNRVCNGILAFEGDGRVLVNEGNYDDYIAKREERRAAARAQAAPTVAAPRAVARETKRKLTWKESKELETIEAEIHRVEGEVARLEGIFSGPDFYEKHGERTAELTAELAAARAEAERLFERWHELEEIRAGAAR